MARRIFALLCIFCLLLSGCCSKKNVEELKNDFKANDEYLFHGLKESISYDNVIEKENISTKSFEKLYDYAYYYPASDNLYGLPGKANYVYLFDDKTHCYSMGGVVWLYDDEKELKKGCEQLSDLLEETFGMPDYSQTNKGTPKEDKKDTISDQEWKSLKNPPNLSANVNGDNVELSDYENEHNGESAVPVFWWGNSQKGTSLRVEVYNNPFMQKGSDDLRKHSYIKLVVYPKVAVPKWFTFDDFSAEQGE